MWAAGDVVRVMTDGSNESGKLTKTAAYISYTQRQGSKLLELLCTMCLNNQRRSHPGWLCVIEILAGLSPDLRQRQMADLSLEGTYWNWKLSRHMSNCKNRTVGRKLLISARDIKAWRRILQTHKLIRNDSLIGCTGRFKSCEISCLQWHWLFCSLTGVAGSFPALTRRTLSPHNGFPFLK